MAARSWKFPPSVSFRGPFFLCLCCPFPIQLACTPTAWGWSWKEDLAGEFLSSQRLERSRACRPRPRPCASTVLGFSERILMFSSSSQDGPPRFPVSTSWLLWASPVVMSVKAPLDHRASLSAVPLWSTGFGCALELLCSCL